MFGCAPGMGEALPASRGGLGAAMSGREFILGLGLSVVDASKGRAALPAPLRNAIIANNSQPGTANDRGIFIGQHPNGKCLVGYDKGQMETIRRRITEAEERRSRNAADEVGFDLDARRRQFGRFEQVALDPSGRFTLSKQLRRWGQIDGLAYMHGLGDLIEIWNPHLLLADPEVPEDQKQDCRDEMEEKGLL